MPKILHAADFHLDSPFGSLNEERARQRRQECRALADRLVDYANDHGADMMLLMKQVLLSTALITKLLKVM